MAELWQEAWAGACAVTAVSGGANAAYFTATSARATEAGAGRAPRAPGVRASASTNART